MDASIENRKGGAKFPVWWEWLNAPKIEEVVRKSKLDIRVRLRGSVLPLWP